MRETKFAALLQSVSPSAVPLEDVVFVAAMLELLGAALDRSPPAAARWPNDDAAVFADFLNVAIEFALTVLHRLPAELRASFDPRADAPDATLLRLFAQLVAFLDSVCCGIDPDDTDATAVASERLSRLSAAFRPTSFPSLGDPDVLADTAASSAASATSAPAPSGSRASIDRGVLSSLISPSLSKVPAAPAVASAPALPTAPPPPHTEAKDIVAQGASLFALLRGPERLLRTASLLLAAAIDAARAVQPASPAALSHLAAAMDQVNGIVYFLSAVDCSMPASALEPLARLLAQLAEFHGTEVAHQYARLAAGASDATAAQLVHGSLLGDVTRLADSAADFVARNVCVFGAARVLATLAATDDRAAISRLVGRGQGDASCDLAFNAVTWCAALWDETAHSFTLREQGGDAKLVVSDRPWPATQLSPEDEQPIYLFAPSPVALPFALLQQHSPRTLQRALLGDATFLDGIFACVALGFAGLSQTRVKPSTAVAVAASSAPSAAAAATPARAASGIKAPPAPARATLSASSGDQVIDLFGNDNLMQVDAEKAAATKPATSKPAAAAAAAAAPVAAPTSAAAPASASSAAADDAAAPYAQLLVDTLRLLATMASDSATAPMFKAQLRDSHLELLAFVAAQAPLSDAQSVFVRAAWSAILHCLGHESAVGDRVVFRVVGACRSPHMPSRAGSDVLPTLTPWPSAMSRAALAVVARCLIRSATVAAAPDQLSLVGQAWVALVHSLSSEAFGSEVAPPTHVGGVLLGEQLPMFLFIFHAIDSDNERRALLTRCSIALVSVVQSLAQHGSQALRCEPAAHVVALLRYAALHAAVPPSAALVAWMQAALSDATDTLPPVAAGFAVSASATRSPCALASLDALALAPIDTATSVLIGGAPGDLLRRLAQLMTAALASPDAVKGGFLAESCWQLLSALSLSRELTAITAADRQRLPVLELLTLLEAVRSDAKASAVVGALVSLVGHATTLADSGQGATRLFAVLCGTAVSLIDALANKRALWLRAALVARGRPALRDLQSALLRLLLLQRGRLLRAQVCLAVADTPFATNGAVRKLLQHALDSGDSHVFGALARALGNNVRAEMPATVGAVPPLDVAALAPLGLQHGGEFEATLHVSVLQQASTLPEPPTPHSVSLSLALVKSLLYTLGHVARSSELSPSDDATSMLLLEAVGPLLDALPPMLRNALLPTSTPVVRSLMALTELARFELAPLRAGDALDSRLRGSLVGPLRSVCHTMLLYANAPRGRADLVWFFRVAEPSLRGGADAPPLLDLLLASLVRSGLDAPGLRARALMLCHLLLTDADDAADELTALVVAAFERTTGLSVWCMAVLSTASLEDAGVLLLSLLAKHGSAKLRRAIADALLPGAEAAFARNSLQFPRMLAVLRAAVVGDGASQMQLATTCVRLLKTVCTNPSLATSRDAQTCATCLLGFVASLARAAQPTVESASSMAVDVRVRQGSGVKRPASADDRLRRSASLLMGGTDAMYVTGLDDDDDEDDDDDDDGGARKRASGAALAASSGAPGAGDAAAAAGGGSGRTMAEAMQADLCTFTATGSNFEKQHWYHCYTCGLSNSEGCCSVCVRRCHAGHDVSYARFSRFFCDCGAGAMKTRSCESLSASGAKGGAEQEAEAEEQIASELDASTACVEPVALFDEADVHDDVRAALRALLYQGDGSGALVDVFGTSLERLHGRLVHLLDASAGSGDASELVAPDRASLGASGLLRHGRRTVVGAVSNVKWGAGADVNRKLTSAFRDGSQWRAAIAATADGQLMAIAEADCIEFLTCSDLLQAAAAASASETPAPVNKSALSSRGKCSTSYQAVGVEFSAVSPQHLLVWGASDCEVLTLNERGEAVDRLAVQLALDDADALQAIVTAFWLPQSATSIVVVTPQLVKVFDLAQDAIAPTACFGVAESTIVDATIVRTPNGAPSTLVVMTRAGMLLTSDLDAARSHQGVYYLYAAMAAPGNVSTRGRNGLSVHWHDATRVLFAAWTNSAAPTIAALRLGAADDGTLKIDAAMVVGNASTVRRVPNVALVDAMPGVVVGRIASGEAIAVSLRRDGAHVQVMPTVSGRLIGMTPIVLTGDGGVEHHLISLYDGGVLQVTRVSAEPSAEADAVGASGAAAKQAAAAAAATAAPGDVVKEASAACQELRRLRAVFDGIRNLRERLRERFDEVQNDAAELKQSKDAKSSAAVAADGDATTDATESSSALEDDDDFLEFDDALLSAEMDAIEATRNWPDLFFAATERADPTSVGLDDGGSGELLQQSAGAGNAAAVSTPVGAVRPPPMPGVKAKNASVAVSERLQLLEDLLGSRLRRSSSALEPASSQPSGSGAAAPPASQASQAPADAGAAAAPTFPVDFFEHVDCITSAITYGGDLTAGYSSSDIHALLQQRGSALCGPPEPFTLTITARPSTAICGIRVLVGHTNASRVPSAIVVAGRRVAIQHGVRRWYDMPLTPAEMRRVGRELGIVVHPPLNNVDGEGAQLDGLEVYAYNKASADAVAAKTAQAAKTAKAPQKEAARAAREAKVAAETLQMRALTLVAAAAVRLLAPALEGDTRDRARRWAVAALSDALPSAAVAPVRVQLRELVLRTTAGRAEFERELTAGAVSALIAALRLRVEGAAKPAAPTRAAPSLQLSVTPVAALSAPLDALLQRLQRLLRDGAVDQLAEVWRRESELPALLVRAFGDTAVSASAMSGSAADRARHRVSQLASLLHALFASARYTDNKDNFVQHSIPLLLSPVESIRCAASAVLCQLLPAPGASVAAVDEGASAAGAAPTSDSFASDIATRLVERMLQMIDKALALGGAVALPFFQTLHVLVLQHHDAAGVRALLPRLLATLLPAQVDNTLCAEFGGAALARSSGLEVRMMCLKMLAALTTLPRATSKPQATSAGAGKRTLLATSPAFADAVLSTLAKERVLARLYALLERVSQQLEARVGDVDGDGVASAPAAAAAAAAASASSSSSKRAQQSAQLAASSDGTLVGSGALLKVRGQEARRSYLPFFNEAYVRDHASDLFAEHVELLGEAALKLALEFVRPMRRHLHDAVVGTDDARRAQWVQLLNRFVYAPRGAAFPAGVKYGKKLLIALLESKAAYYLARDSFVFERALARIWSMRDACGSAYGNLPYTRRVALVRVLVQLSEAAFLRPGNWCLFSAQHPSHVAELISAACRLTREAALPALRLVLLLLRTASAAPQTSDAALQTHLRAVANDILAREQALVAFVRLILLGGAAAELRSAARNLLHAAWPHADDSGRALLLRTLVRAAPSFPQFGAHASDAQQLFAFAIRERVGQCGASEQAAICDAVFDTLRAVNEQIARHPNAALYRSLASVLEFDGYYLESEPCSVCSDPEMPFASSALAKLAAEQKFTSSTQVVRLRRCIELRQVSVTVAPTGSRGARLVRAIDVHYSTAEVADVGELAGNWSRWTLACRLKVAPNGTTAECTLPIPVAVNNLLFEFSDFYDTASARERLMCPRCNRAVTNKHGTCDSCRENAYQCRQCRNINYENLDAFLCNECGFCKHAKFAFSVDHRPAIVAPRVESEDERVAALAVIDRESVKAHEQYERIRAQHGPLAKLASTLSERDEHVRIVGAEQIIAQLPALASVSKKVFALAVLYGKECQQSFDALIQSTRVLVATRRELLRYAQSSEHGGGGGGDELPSEHGDLLAPPRAADSSDHRSGCFGCSMTYVTQCMTPLQQLSLHEQTRCRLVSRGVIEELVANNVRDGPLATRAAARRAACLFTRGDDAATARLGQLLRTSIDALIAQPRANSTEDLRALVQLLVCSGMYADEPTWQSRFQVVADVFFRALGASSLAPGTPLPPVVDANLARHVLVPCMRLIIARCTPPSASASLASLAFDGDSSVPQSPQLTSTSDAGTGKIARNKSAAAAAAAPSRGGDDSAAAATMTVVSKSGGADGAGGDDDDASTIRASYSAWRAGSLSFDAWLGAGADVAAAQASVEAAPMAVDTDVHARLTARQRGVVRRCVRRWRVRRGAQQLRASGTDVGHGMRVLDHLAAQTWLQPLFLASCSRTLRTVAAQLVTVLCGESEARALRFAEMCAQLLGAIPTSGQSGSELLELFGKLTEPPSRRLFLAARGYVPRVMELIAHHVARMAERERAGLAASVGDGGTLRPLVKTLCSFVALPTVRERLKRANALPLVLDSYLSLRGLVLQKTKLTDDAAADLRELLAVLSDGEPQAFLAACVAALGRPGVDQRTLTFVLEQMCSVICPSKKEPDYALVLRKAPTQEEFIRGHMTKNPYSTAELGPLMRDVKNKICRTLDLQGFVDDDNGMELLVRNKIIKLHLPVARVYRSVWQQDAAGAGGGGDGEQAGGDAWRRRASAAEEPGAADAAAPPPMTIVYRLAGLDGEATEDIVDELADARDEQQDPEVEFVAANRMADNGGLEHLLRVLSELRDLSRERELATVLLRLLGACSKLRVNRRALVRLGAIETTLRQLRLAFSGESEAHVAAALVLLPIVESVIAEANLMERSQSSGNLLRTMSAMALDLSGGGALNADADADADDDDNADADADNRKEDERALESSQMSLDESAGRSSRVADRIEQMRTMLERLSSAFVRNNMSIVNSVARVLPFLTYGQRSVIDVLVEHFDEHIAPALVDEAPPPTAATDATGEPSAAERRALLFDACTMVLAAAPSTSRVGVRLRDAMLARSITARLLTYLSTAVAARAGGEEAWQRALARPGMPFALALLATTIEGHAPSQRLVLATPDLLPSLHRMEQTATKVARIGALAENVLESMKSADANAARAVDQIRAASHRDKKRLAQQHRKAVLRTLGIASTDGRSLHVGGAGDALVAQAPEDDEFPCMVCREGYSFKPEEMICVYTYSAPASLARSARHRDVGFETVSHFNAIHASCHREAARADRRMRVPKKEWEGATLRNQQTRCNNLFPVRGLQTSDAEYGRNVDVFWANQGKVAQTSGARPRLLVHDLRSLLLRFATQRSFAAESQGGGRESNLLFLPHWLQMAAYLFEQSGGPATRAAFETQMFQALQRTHRLLEAVAPAQARGERVAALSAPGMPTRTELVAESDDAAFLLALSLVLLSPEQWRAYRYVLFSRLLLEAILTAAAGGASPAAASATASSASSSSAAAAASSASASSSSAALAAAAAAEAIAPPTGASVTELAYARVAGGSFAADASASAKRFRVCHDAFVLFAFVDKLQRALKPPAGEASESLAQLKAQSGASAWVLHMKKLIVPGDTLRAVCRRVLREYEDELLAFEEAQEFVDDAGLLTSVLVKYASVDAYLEDLFETAAVVLKK